LDRVLLRTMDVQQVFHILRETIYY
jgi:hypothetical protein